MTTYQYTTHDVTVVHVIDDDGARRASMLASRVPVGASILPADPPTAEEQTQAAAAAQYATDAAAARNYAKLQALAAMTPAQVQAWVAANVTNLAQAQDAIATLAVAVSLLARRL